MIFFITLRVLAQDLLPPQLDAPSKGPIGEIIIKSRGRQITDPREYQIIYEKKKLQQKLRALQRRQRQIKKIKLQQYFESLRPNSTQSDQKPEVTREQVQKIKHESQMRKYRKQRQVMEFSEQNKQKLQQFTEMLTNKSLSYDERQRIYYQKWKLQNQDKYKLYLKDRKEKYSIMKKINSSEFQKLQQKRKIRAKKWNKTNNLVYKERQKMYAERRKQEKMIQKWDQNDEKQKKIGQNYDINDENGSKLGDILDQNIEQTKDDLKIEKDFGQNTMYMKVLDSKAFQNEKVIQKINLGTVFLAEWAAGAQLIGVAVV